MTLRAPRCGLWPTFVALMSWLCCGDDLRCQREVATTEEVQTLLSRLDAFFARRNLPGYLRAFLPDNPGVHAARGYRLGMLLQNGPASRTSTVVGTPRRIGDRSVARVQHEFRCAARPADVMLRQDTMLVMRRTDDGRLVPTFEVEIPVERADVRDDHFRCPPCNYEFGGAPGWLCVPVARERAQALESASFWLIGTDIGCEISVRVDQRRPAATTLVRLLAGELHVLEPNSVIGEVATWRPTAYATDPPHGLDGARVAVELLHGGGRVVFHVVTFGDLQHVIAVRGSTAGLQTHAAAVAELLATYHLLDPDADHAVVAKLTFRHHTGGELRDNVYCNDPHGIEFTGPAGWTARQMCGSTAFRVEWAHGESRIYLTGYHVPPGMPGWCQRSAEDQVHQVLERVGLQIDDAASTPWREDPATGGSERCLLCMPHSATPSAPGDAKRLLRVIVRGDLLVIADARVAEAADEPAIHAALHSLKKH